MKSDHNEQFIDKLGSAFVTRASKLTFLSFTDTVSCCSGQAMNPRRRRKGMKTTYYNYTTHR